jgi:beta-glucosidase
VVLEQRAGSRNGRLGTRMQLGIIAAADVVDDTAKKLAASADVVVVPVGFDPATESEGSDRSFQLPPGQDQLIKELTSANKNTIVVVNSGGGVDMSSWIDRVPVLFQAWYPGQEGGTALAEILFGDVNPSGKLPVSFERRWEDNPTHASYYPVGSDKRIEYKEGVFVGYRGYEHNHVKPLFPFGYGLSYTTFNYSNLTIKPVAGVAPTRYEVSFDVTNKGTRAGAEVAQVYVGAPGKEVPRPPKELKGFARVYLRPGEKRRVQIPLDARSFSYYDVANKGWRAEPGEYAIMAGRSSEQIELSGKVNISAANKSQ